MHSESFLYLVLCVQAVYIPGGLVLVFFIAVADSYFLPFFSPSSPPLGFYMIRTAENSFTTERKWQR